MKKQLALVATLLAVVALPNQLLSTPDGGAHVTGDHVGDAAEAHATGATDVHAVAKEGVKATDGEKAVADEVATRAGATAAIADGQAARSGGLFANGATVAILSPRTNPFTLAFATFGNTVAGVFGFGATQKLNVAILAAAPATRQVLTTTAANVTSHRVLVALAAGKMVTFRTKSKHWRVRSYLKSVANSKVTLNIDLTPAQLANLRLLDAQIQKMLTSVVYQIAITNGHDIEDKNMLQARVQAQVQALLQGVKITIEDRLRLLSGMGAGMTAETPNVILLWATADNTHTLTITTSTANTIPTAKTVLKAVASH